MTPRKRFGRRARVLAALGLLALAAAAGLYIALSADLPSPEAMIVRAAPDTTKIYDRQGRLLYEVLDPRAGRRTRLRLDQMPLQFRQAVIAVEDANFYAHPGVDIGAVARAIVQAVQAEQIVSGASTITQQLARMLALTPEERESRSVTRKLREMILAVRLTQAYPKDTVLEMYLNEVYFGQLAYGVEAAARTYFGKRASELDLAESALLAGLIQSPSAYNPLVNPSAARERQRVVLGLMAKGGVITDQQAAEAAAEPLHFAADGQRDGASVLRAPHFVAYVRNVLEAQFGAERVNGGGLRVTTTLDLDLQARAEAAVSARLDDLRRRTTENGEPDYNVRNAALVALDPRTGAVRALVGSADYFDAGIDGAVDVALADRQPGSAIKPIFYATAFMRDYTPATVLSDVPTAFTTREGDPYQPENYDHTWHGPLSLRTALATSSNMVAVKVLDHYGSTESAHLACALWDEKRPGAVGPVNAEQYEVAVVDEHDNVLPPGEVGECVSRCKLPYTQMSEYYNMPEETLKAFRNRWLHTGDLCRIDADGWLYFVGRGKDMIRRRGENISSYELESILQGHGAIEECACIPVPSALGEDEVKVVIAPRAGRTLEFDEVMAFCRDNMPRFMVPRYIEFVREVPKLPNHKIDKAALKNEGLTPATWDADTGRHVG